MPMTPERQGSPSKRWLLGSHRRESSDDFGMMRFQEHDAELRKTTIMDVMPSIRHVPTTTPFNENVCTINQESPGKVSDLKKWLSGIGENQNKNFGDGKNLFAPSQNCHATPARMDLVSIPMNKVEQMRNMICDVESQTQMKINMAHLSSKERAKINERMNKVADVQNWLNEMEKRHRTVQKKIPKGRNEDLQSVTREISANSWLLNNQEQNCIKPDKSKVEISRNSQLGGNNDNPLQDKVVAPMTSNDIDAPVVSDLKRWVENMERKNNQNYEQGHTKRTRINPVTDIEEEGEIDGNEEAFININTILNKVDTIGEKFDQLFDAFDKISFDDDDESNKGKTLGVIGGKEAFNFTQSSNSNGNMNRIESEKGEWPSSYMAEKGRKIIYDKKEHDSDCVESDEQENLSMKSSETSGDAYSNLWDKGNSNTDKVAREKKAIDRNSTWEKEDYNTDRVESDKQGNLSMKSNNISGDNDYSNLWEKVDFSIDKSASEKKIMGTLEGKKNIILWETEDSSVQSIQSLEQSWRDNNKRRISKSSIGETVKENTVLIHSETSRNSSVRAEKSIAQSWYGADTNNSRNVQYDETSSEDAISNDCESVGDLRSNPSEKEFKFQNFLKDPTLSLASNSKIQVSHNSMPLEQVGSGDNFERINNKVFSNLSRTEVDAISRASKTTIFEDNISEICPQHDDNNKEKMTSKKENSLRTAASLNMELSPNQTPISSNHNNINFDGSIASSSILHGEEILSPQQSCILKNQSDLNKPIELLYSNSFQKEDHSLELQKNTAEKRKSLGKMFKSVRKSFLRKIKQKKKVKEISINEDSANELQKLSLAITKTTSTNDDDSPTNCEGNNLSFCSMVCSNGLESYLPYVYDRHQYEVTPQQVNSGFPSMTHIVPETPHSLASHFVRTMSPDVSTTSTSTSSTFNFSSNVTTKLVEGTKTNVSQHVGWLKQQFGSPLKPSNGKNLLLIQ